MSAKVIVYSLVAACSLGLFISSALTARQCYVTPCYEGKGLQMLWSVDWGESFQVVLVSLLALGHVVVSYFSLFGNKGSAVFNGFLVSSAIVIGLVLLTQSVYWGQEAIMIDDLDTHLNGYSFFSNNEVCEHNYDQASCEALASTNDCKWVAYYKICQKAMHVDPTVNAKFDATTVLAVLTGVSHLIFAYILTSSEDNLAAPVASKNSQFDEKRTRISSAYSPGSVSNSGNRSSTNKKESVVMSTEGPVVHVDNAGL
eukprot:c12142_g1_i1.p1 GENE.c12142_g1_i1~~c12142_g1_i1.p1  ORF type:complete len:269 (+),score=121.00 c12142_g1_i1:38-808(+)